MPAEPLSQYVVRNTVPAEQMCAFAPDVIREMMREFLRNVSPDWTTVHLDIAQNQFLGNWEMTLDGRGLRRPGANRG